MYVANGIIKQGDLIGKTYRFTDVKGNVWEEFKITKVASNRFTAIINGRETVTNMVVVSAENSSIWYNIEDLNVEIF